jgi:DNA-binding LacI/PurR family transcriptional regulator
MATMAEVAARAGVGIGTVSRVLSGSPNVSARTRAKVLEAVESVGYQRSQRRVDGHRSTGLIGVLVPFFDEPSTYERLRGIVGRLQPHGFEVVLFNVDSPDSARARIMEVPRHPLLDGLIVISLPLRADEGQRLASARFPTVLVDTVHPALPSVRIDDREGGRLATDHLIALGHERIAFVGEPSRNPFGFVSSALREEGFRSAMADAGLAVDRSQVRHGPHLRAAARQFATELLMAPTPPTAIVAASDIQAIGVLEAARELSVSVPGQLSVIGYDDIELASHVGLTTVRQSLQDSGQRGADMMLSLVSSRERNIFSEQIPLELVVRGTTGQVPGGRRRTAALPPRRRASA